MKQTASSRPAGKARTRQRPPSLRPRSAPPPRLDGYRWPRAPIQPASGALGGLSRAARHERELDARDKFGCDRCNPEKAALGLAGALATGFRHPGGPGGGQVRARWIESAQGEEGAAITWKRWHARGSRQETRFRRNHGTPYLSQGWLARQLAPSGAGERAPSPAQAAPGGRSRAPIRPRAGGSGSLLPVLVAAWPSCAAASRSR